MPQWKELPDGRWVVVPSVSTYYDQLSGPKGSQFNVADYSDPNYLLRQAERLRKGEKLTLAERGLSSPDKKTLLGSLAEGVKAIPGGVLDLGVSSAEAAIGVLTPGIDLSIEKRLRKISQDRALKRDPLYRDSLAVGVGQGLGQVGGLVGLSKIPGYGKLLGVGSAVALGISDQTRRIAEYEQRTGENIPWYKESMAHLLGGATGLLEIILPHKLANMRSVSRMQKMLTRTTPLDLATTSGKIRSAVESVGLEGMQEGLAQGLQSMTARGLYDPNALEDLGSSMMEDAKVGGIVGGIADVAATMLLGPHQRNRGPHTTEEMQSVAKEMRQSKHRYYKTENGKATLKALDNGLVADPLASIMEGTSIAPQMAEDISAMFNGEWSALPKGFEEALLEGGIEVEQIKAIRDELHKRTSAAITRLQKQGKSEGSLQGEKNYEDAANAIIKIQSTRISALDKALEELGLGWRRLGGISDTKEYQQYWDDDESTLDPAISIFDALEVQVLELVGKGKEQKKLSNVRGERKLTGILEGLSGGNFGRRGLKRIAEVLGVHKGPGSEAVLTNIPDKETNQRPDSTLASSDAANFSIDNVGRAIFGLDGKAGQLKGIDYTDNQKLVDSTRQADKNIKELEDEVTKTERDNPIFRYEAEALDGINIDKDSTAQEWQRVREQNAKTTLLKQSNLYELIAREREKRGGDYAIAMANRLSYLQEYLNSPNNAKAKRGAITRLQFDTQYGDGLDEIQFDLWMDEQQRLVQESIQKSTDHRNKLDAEIGRMQEELDKLDPAQAAEAQIKLMPAVRAAFKRDTKNVSALDFVRLTNLFNPSVKDSQSIIHQGMVIKAMADIAMWQVDNSDHKVEDGVLVLNETVPLVKDFINTELRNRQLAVEGVTKKLFALVGRQNLHVEGMSIDSAMQAVSQIPGVTPTNYKLIDKFIKEEGDFTYEQLSRLITEDDIKQLLRSKNIFLRGDYDGDTATHGNIGKRLEGKLGVGVESTPFKDLLTDMTGALSWEQASDAQRLLMYSRLLKLPSHRVYQDPTSSNQNYLPLYLPNLYQSKVSRQHLNTITKLLVGRKKKASELKIVKLKKDAEKELGANFDSKIFDESLASLVEMGLLSLKDQNKPIVDSEVGVKEGEAASTKQGDLGSSGNPKRKSIDSLVDPLTGPDNKKPDQLPSVINEGDTPLYDVKVDRRTAIPIGLDEKLYNGDVVTLHERLRKPITIKNLGKSELAGLQKTIDEKAPHRKTVTFKRNSKGGPGSFLADDASLETEALDPTNGTAGGTPIIDPVIGEILMKSVEHAYNAQRVDPKKDVGGIVWYNPNSQLGTGKYRLKEQLDEMIRVVRTVTPDGKGLNQQTINKKNAAMREAGWLRGRHYPDNALRRAIYTIDGIAEATRSRDVTLELPINMAMVSGNAEGSDKTWEAIGREYGLEDVTHHTIDTITEQESKEARPYLIAVNKKIGRTYPSTRSERTNKLLERDYLQARDADAVFAIGTLVEPTTKGKKAGMKWGIEGGTEWAVRVAIDMGKPVYIFDQAQGVWHTTTNGIDIRQIDTPTLTPNFAAIGTSNLTARGKEAIRDVFDKSSKPSQQLDMLEGTREKRIGQGVVTFVKNPRSSGASLAKVLGEKLYYVPRTNIQRRFTRPAGIDSKTNKKIYLTIDEQVQKDFERTGQYPNVQGSVEGTTETTKGERDRRRVYYVEVAAWGEPLGLEYNKRHGDIEPNYTSLLEAKFDGAVNPLLLAKLNNLRGRLQEHLTPSQLKTLDAIQQGQDKWRLRHPTIERGTGPILEGIRLKRNREMYEPEHDNYLIMTKTGLVPRKRATELERRIADKNDPVDVAIKGTPLQLSWEDDSEDTIPKIVSAQSILEQAKTVLQKYIDAPILPMKFRDGQGFQGSKLTMAEGYEGKTTFQLVKSGERTGTSRAEPIDGVVSGSIMRIENPAGGADIYVEATSDWTKVSGIDPNEWSFLEGWDLNTYHKLAKAGYYQITYKILKDQSSIKLGSIPVNRLKKHGLGAIMGKLSIGTGVTTYLNQEANKLTLETWRDGLKDATLNPLTSMFPIALGSSTTSPTDKNGRLTDDYRDIELIIRHAVKSGEAGPIFILSEEKYATSTNEQKMVKWLIKMGYRQMPDVEANDPYVLSDSGRRNEWKSGKSGIWMPTPATDFAIKTGLSAENFQDRVNHAERLLEFERFDMRKNEVDILEWAEQAATVSRIRKQFNQIGLMPYKEIISPLSWGEDWATPDSWEETPSEDLLNDELVLDPTYLAPWYESINNSLWYPLNTPGSVLEEWAEIISAMSESPEYIGNIFSQIAREQTKSAPTAEAWIAIFRQLGYTKIPWIDQNLILDDKDLPSEAEISDEELAAYRKEIQESAMSDFAHFATKQDVIAQKKYKKVYAKIFPDTKVPVFMISSTVAGGSLVTLSGVVDSSAKKNLDRSDARRGIIIDPNWIQEQLDKGPDADGNIYMTNNRPGTIPIDEKTGEPASYEFGWALSPTDLEALYKNIDDMIVFVIAHEKGHQRLPSADLGEIKRGTNPSPMSRSVVENAVNNLAQAEQSRLAFDLVQEGMARLNKERMETTPEFNEDTIRVDTEGGLHGPEALQKHLTDNFVDVTEEEPGMGTYAPPFSEKRIEIDKQIYFYNAHPKKVKELLSSKELSGSAQALVDKYNQEHPNEKLSLQEYIEIFASHITSEFGLRELAELGVVETVAGRVKKASEIVPVDTFLQVNTPDGARIINALIGQGAIPSSLKKRSMVLRREFINTVRTRFEILASSMDTGLKTLKIPDNIRKEYVADADSIFQGLSEVGLRGELLPKTKAAIYDSASNRIIINLSAIDPNDMPSAQRIIQDASYHEGVHALIRRDNLYDSELDVLLDYAKKHVVSKEWNPSAHEMGVTWFESKVYDLKDTNLNEADIEEEAMTDLMVALTQNKVPDALIKNRKIRKTKRFLGDIFEGIIGAAKDSEIVDLLQVLANVESGRAGERGSGYQGDTEFTEGDEIRSTRLLRYADPKEVDELVKAIALRDAAKSDTMRILEQTKIDALSDKITQRRTAIQESAGVVSQIDAITNIKEGVKQVQNENSYAIPLLNGEIWSDPRDPEARRVALDEFLKSRRGETNYTMPRDYMDMFNKQHDVTGETKKLVDQLVVDGIIGPIDGDPFRKSLESGVLSGDKLTGEDPSETLDHLEKSTVSNMRYQFLDRRQWTVEQTDRILAAQDRAMVDARTSALVMWRNADNTVNWLGGMLKQGPLSYLGYSTGSGEFDISPSYDNELAKKYNSSGRIKGLLDIFKFISKPIDEQVASAYGIAKRIQWTQMRRDETQRMITPNPNKPNLLMDFQDPDLQKQKEMFDRAYEKINPKDKTTDKRKWRDAQIEEVINRVESKESHIVEFWDNYQAYNRAMIRMAYSASIITRGQRDEWLSMPFTPFYRDTNPIESFPIGSGQQLAKRGRLNIERALEGSLEPISSDLINNIMENTQALVRDAMINVAASRTARDSVALNEGERVTLSDLAGDAESRVIRVMEQGIPVHYKLDDAQQAMAVMMLGFNPKKRIEDLFGGMKAGEYVSKGLTGSASLLREAVTRTPPFQIKNIFRDSWQASTIVGGGPSLVINSIRNALDPDVQRRAEERGLSIGIDFVAEPGEYGNVMRKQLESANLDWTNPLAPFAAIWTFLGKIAKQSEVATRVAVYDRVFAMTGDRALAQYLAVEIMNYGRRGANPALSTFMSTVPFMNGRLQGTDVIVRGLRSKKGSSDVPSLTAYGMTNKEYEALPFWQQNRQQIINRGLILSAATALMYWMMHDDEEYQDLRDEVKADNWLFPLGDHAWLKLPIPFEVGVLFKVIPEQIMRAIFEEDYDLVDVGSEYKRQLQTSLSLGGPQLIGPLLGAMSNYDKYRKDFIVDPFTAERSSNEQRNRFTSNTARTISDAVNMIPLVNNLDFLTSPMKMEYMLRQYFGTMGGYVTTVADRVARMGILPTIPFDPLMNWSEAESIVGSTVDFDWESMIGGPGVANVPILGDLLVDPRTRAGRQQQFYEIVKELDSVIATLNSISDEDRERGFEYQQKHQDLLNKQGQIRSMEKRMTSWRERREGLADIPKESLTDDQKRQRYERLLQSRLGILHSMDDLLSGETRADKSWRWGNK